MMGSYVTLGVFLHRVAKEVMADARLEGIFLSLWYRVLCCQQIRLCNNCIASDAKLATQRHRYRIAHAALAIASWVPPVACEPRHWTKKGIRESGPKKLY